MKKESGLKDPKAALPTRRSSMPMVTLMEESRCQCLRRACKVAPNSYDAALDKEGNMVKKCPNCKNQKKDCISVEFPLHFTRVIRQEALLRNSPSNPISPSKGNHHSFCDFLDNK